MIQPITIPINVVARYHPNQNVKIPHTPKIMSIIHHTKPSNPSVILIAFVIVNVIKKVIIRYTIPIFCHSNIINSLGSSIVQIITGRKLISLIPNLKWNRYETNAAKIIIHHSLNFAGSHFCHWKFRILRISSISHINHILNRAKSKIYVSCGVTSEFVIYHLAWNTYDNHTNTHITISNNHHHIVGVHPLCWWSDLNIDAFSHVTASSRIVLPALK